MGAVLEAVVKRRVHICMDHARRNRIRIPLTLEEVGVVEVVEVAERGREAHVCIRHTRRDRIWISPALEQVRAVTEAVVARRVGRIHFWMDHTHRNRISLALESARALTEAAEATLSSMHPWPLSGAPGGRLPCFLQA